MCKWGNTTVVEINGAPRGIDTCIVPIIKALNDAGITTIASCCGHGKQPGSIGLKGSKEIRLFTFEQARKIDKLFPPIND